MAEEMVAAELSSESSLSSEAGVSGMLVVAIEGIAPVSQSWAKKHILGFSDEEIRLDLQQQRIEKAVAAELTNTPTIIVHTGIFDNIDKLYGQQTGTTSASASVPPPPPGGDMGGDMGGMEPPPMGGEEGGGSPPPPGPTPGGEAGVTPESSNRDSVNILLENSSLVSESEYINLSRAKNSLGEMEDELNRLLKD